MSSSIRPKPQSPPPVSIAPSPQAANQNSPQIVRHSDAPTMAERAVMTGVGVATIAGSGLLSSTAITGGGALLVISSVLGVPNLGLWAAVGAAGVAVPVAGVALGATLLRQAFKNYQTK